MFYDHQQIEKKWQKYWEDNQTYKTSDKTDKPKFYVLDMFPYPSGAGLHVGHPLGYIASDIYARYKRHQGFNVLHPVGYDSFGLPAEQYAIQTGTHPAITTEQNITRYEEQLRKIGFSFDWSREVRTSDASYYKWTQWIFIELFHSWYNKNTDKAESIKTLIKHFEEKGTVDLNANQNDELNFTSEEWKNASEIDKEDILLNYRLAYRAETTVNWCPALGTVLANDEVKDGKSERGGFPVFQKKMMQWSMRISAYSERLLQGLKTLDWPQPLKDSQEYWIGKSQGAQVKFNVDGHDEIVEVFTTRPDTIFGATFMVLAPENPLVETITTEEQKAEVDTYIEETSKKTERDRMSDVKNVSGAFTGSYAINPFSNEKMPIYISDYVLMGYGTGAVMAVPAHDERDHRFAKKFNLEIKKVVETEEDVQEKSFDSKTSVCVNSDFLNGLNYDEAKALIIDAIEKKGIGHGTTNYRQRDAIFSRQRYWGEPVPIYYKDGMPYTLPASALPLELPEVEKYLPTEDGDPPLGNSKTFAWDEANQKVVATDLVDDKTVFPLELSTMPGWAGSSWYFLRYMDPNNGEVFANKDLSDYWGQVDLYIGGSEHATGHLLYSRFWNMFLKDRGYINQDEPFQKLINQGMILGMSAFVYRFNYNSTTDNESKSVFISKNLVDNLVKGNNVDLLTNFISKNIGFNLKSNLILTKDSFQQIHVDVSLLKGTSDELDTDAFKSWRPDYADAEFILEDGKYITGREVEKMSKSKYNVVNPDDICEEYGADGLRLYEMFLGPLEQSKPWNTQGLSGVYGFLKKFWNLYFNGEVFEVSDEEPTKAEYKVLHTLIKKVVYDIENFSFNTSVSSFMIAVNELQKLKCNKRNILEPLAVIISPYAPHICEELWSLLGNKESSIEFQKFPILNEDYLVEDEIEYPVSVNGKMKFKIALPATLSAKEVEDLVLQNDKMGMLLEGKTPKKIIVVPKKIVNIVI
ncbi:leucine--tRNA ligase [Chryseobacterium indoltheticum]|uniref:Leucine--tRNA ligase n=1 Tax=Chryseobacterium indoltheticum TaxID=254 RepID=A0A381JS29_9FLAO|nr:class I tRNA ligase family protein [Chryseobacterium indoltheticum]AZA75700.1 leucine--tRNA ligase [Chryseobacterium indoltheticum]SIQ48102.1 leucyl-tRNA synthetase [Chryseobacterium indoltheticum]SUY53835.1 Leucine--tRNA ligase [Chryseobacterium indoltheticum]